MQTVNRAVERLANSPEKSIVLTVGRSSDINVLVCPWSGDVQVRIGGESESVGIRIHIESGMFGEKCVDRDAGDAGEGCSVHSSATGDHPPTACTKSQKRRPRLIDPLGPSPFTKPSARKIRTLLRRASSEAETFLALSASELCESEDFLFLVCDVAILVGALHRKLGFAHGDMGFFTLPRGYSMLFTEGPPNEMAFYLYDRVGHEADLTEYAPYFPYTIIGDYFDEESAPRLLADISSGWIEEVIERATRRK